MEDECFVPPKNKMIKSKFANVSHSGNGKGKDLKIVLPSSASTKDVSKKPKGLPVSKGKTLESKAPSLDHANQIYYCPLHCVKSYPSVDRKSRPPFSLHLSLDFPLLNLDEEFPNEILGMQEMEQWIIFAL